MSAVPASPYRRRSRAGRRDGKWGHTFAALDLGTNNCRLLVARPKHDGFRVVEALSRIVRLGEGLDRSGTLSEAAMTRAIGALRQCAAAIRRRGVTRARHVATSACRRAGNVDVFLDRVAAETGLAIEVIAPEEEARLAGTGCAPLLDPEIPHALLIDVGGGSTELIWQQIAPGQAPETIGFTSLPCGVVGFAERYGGDRVAPETYAAMVDDVADMLASFEAAHCIRARIAEGAVQMLGSSGTVTTVAGVHMRLARYDRSVVDGSDISFDAIFAVNRELTGLDYEARAAIPSVGRDRADLVVAGCAILDAVCRTWPVGSLRVADRGVREGVLLDLMGAAEAARGARR